MAINLTYMVIHLILAIFWQIKSNSPIQLSILDGAGLLSGNQIYYDCNLVSFKNGGIADDAENCLF